MLDLSLLPTCITIITRVFMISRFISLSNLIFVAIGVNSIAMASFAEEKSNLPMAQSCREFASNLHKTIASKTEGNVVDSPLGTHLALSYLFHGTGSHTAEEMIAGLRLHDTEQLSSEYKELMKILNNMDTVELNLANAIFVQNGVELCKTFHTVGTDFYNFTLQNIDFRDNVTATKTINSWVSKSTQDKIRNIISPADVDEYIKVVMAIAIYFKGQWRYRFDIDATERKIFHVSEKIDKKVPTMYKQFKYFQGEIPSLKARFLEIPYMDQTVDMIIVLPDEIEGLKFVEENFDWNAIINAKRSKRLTQLHLPKFKIDAMINLKDVLTELGFTSMFEDSANFTKMSDFPLKVGSVIQRSFIEIDEIGTEAAATTVIRMMMKRSLDSMDEEPNEFIVDRPFIAAIRHVTHKIPLFLSSVRDINVTPEKDEL